MTVKGTTHFIPIGTHPCTDNQKMEFHISSDIRRKCDFNSSLFSSSGNIIFTDQKSVHTFVQKYNEIMNPEKFPNYFLNQVS